MEPTTGASRAAGLWSTLHRAVKKRAHAVAVGSTREHTMDVYSRQAPSVQNALDIFAGQWASKLPAPLDGMQAGTALLFDDPRLKAAIASFGGVRGRRCLELGPLEAGHTYILDRGGASEIVAVEANSRAFLKCLLVKELLGLPAARFVYGDFTEYLNQTTERFDVAIASGVLYHMINPVELLARLAAVSDKVFLWTHYYDEKLLASQDRTAHRVVQPQPATHGGYHHHLYRWDYGAALDSQGFCGGSRPHCHWLAREDILGALRHFGLTQIETADEQPQHPNGPAFSVTAQRR